MVITKGSILHACALTCLLGAGAGALVWPQYNANRELSVEIERLRADLAMPNSGPEVIEQLTNRLLSLREIGEKRMTPIPRESDVAGLVRDMSKMLDAIGIDKREMTTGAARELPEASTLPMSIILTGDFTQVNEVVGYIESLPRLVRFERLRFTTERAGSESVDRSGVVRAELVLDVFFAPRDASAIASAADVADEGRRP